MKKSDYNILVVDDDTSMKELMQRAFESLGYKVTAVTNPDEAIKAVRLKTIHFAVVDVMLSKMNGVELASKLRTAGLGESPLILISGIFTDSSFAKDAIAKTGALNFFPKPFNLDEISKVIEDSLKVNDVTEKVSIQSLLSQKKLSHRECIRVVDQLDEITGLDFIFILNIFLEADLCGHINLIDDQENVYGVSFCDGCLSRVDTKDSPDYSWQYLQESKYYLDEHKEYHENFISTDLLNELVEKSLLSPHVMKQARRFQILKDLDTIYSLNKIKLNFSPLELVKSGFEFALDEIEAHWKKTLNKDQSHYFKEFYKALTLYTFVEGAKFSDLSKKISSEDVQFIKNLVNEGESLQSVFDSKFGKMSLIHYLAVKNIISFENFESSDQIKNFSIKKLANTYNQIKDYDPYEIFKYFGASDNLTAVEVSILYKEFAKLNHPDKFLDIEKEDAEVVHSLFSLVTSAHNQLTNDEKRKELENSMAQKSVESQMRSEALADDGLRLVRTGKYIDGIKLIEEALSKYELNKTKLFWCWGILKLSFKKDVSEPKMSKVSKIINEYPAADRKTAHYQHVLGLSHLSEQNKREAFECFKKALTIDSRFMDSRREIAKLSKPKDDSNIFTGDITTVFTKMFKK